jgi:hypothetical protein
MDRFLVIHPVPLGSTEPQVKDGLERLARHAHDLGIQPVETIYSVDQGQAYTLCEGGDAGTVLAATRRAGIADAEVVRAERIYTDLLDVPRRAR